MKKQLRNKERFEYVIKYGIFRFGEKSPVSVDSTNKSEVLELAKALNLVVLKDPKKFTKPPLNCGDKEWVKLYNDNKYQTFKVKQVNPERNDLALQFAKNEAIKTFDLNGAYNDFNDGLISVDELNEVINKANKYVNDNIVHVNKNDIDKLERSENTLKGRNVAFSLDEKAAIHFHVSTASGGRKGVHLTKIHDEVKGIYFHVDDTKPFDQLGYNPYTGSSHVSLFRGSKQGTKKVYPTLSVATESINVDFSKVPLHKRARGSHGRPKETLNDEQLIAIAYDLPIRNTHKIRQYLRLIGGTNKQIKRINKRLEMLGEVRK